VTGDGEHTVTELIKIENATIRGVPYVDKLARIDTDSACQYLGEKMNQVPKKMEHFQVVGIGNYGAGGALKDVTDTMPAWMYEQALAVSKQLGIVSAGIDYMVAPTTDKYTHDNISDVALIEINKNPALFMHDIVDGSDRVIRKYIDYLETLDA
jgi:D-alanine-D-alanine ligase-like ATP-grasp enzyme